MDERVTERRDSHASSSRETSLEPQRRMVPGNHSIYTHFPKHRNCEICRRTKIIRSPWRKRTGEVLPCAEFFCDLIAAYHKLLGKGCKSRNNHRYAVVVQDMATQWIQSYPCKTKTSQETERSLQKFVEPSRKPIVIYTDASLEFGKACEDISWNHCTSTPHRSETNVIAERAVRRIKAGTSAVFFLQSGLDENWWADSLECYCYLRKIQDRVSDGKTPYERRFGGQGDGVPKACQQQAAAGPRGSRTCVCASTFVFRCWHTQWEEWRINVLPWYRLVGVVSTSSQTHKEGRSVCPLKRESGQHVLRGRQSSPTPESPNSQPLTAAVGCAPG